MSFVSIQHKDRLHAFGLHRDRKQTKEKKKETETESRKSCCQKKIWQLLSHSSFYTGEIFSLIWLPIVVEHTVENRFFTAEKTQQNTLRLYRF